MLTRVVEQGRYADGDIPAGDLEAGSGRADRLSFVEKCHDACTDEVTAQGALVRDLFPTPGTGSAWRPGRQWFRAMG